MTGISNNLFTRSSNTPTVVPMKNFLINRQAQRRSQATTQGAVWYRDTALMGALFSGGTGSFAMISGDDHLGTHSSSSLAS